MLCTILLFGMLSCGSCVEASKVLSSYDVRYVDVSRERVLAKFYGIYGVPTVVVLKEGKEVARYYGVPSKSFVERLSSHCSS